MVDSANLYELLRGRFPHDLNRPALIPPAGTPVSYAQLETESARYAGLIAALGIAPGDRVAVQVDKSPQALMLYLACLRVGAVYVPMNPAYRHGEVMHIVDDAKPKLMVCRPQAQADLQSLVEAAGVEHLLTLGTQGDGGFTEAAHSYSHDFHTRPRTGADLAALLYTSGTTGLPKGVMLSHHNLASNALTLHRVWGWQADDVLLHTLPLFHTHGLFVACHCALLGGTPMLFLPKFDLGQVLDQLPRATVLMGVPTFYTRLLTSDRFNAETCGNMRLFISGSAPLLEQTFRAFQQRTGHRILERYGMTETCMSTSNPLDGERKPGTVGKSLPDIDVRVVAADGALLTGGEVGGVEVAGPNVFQGYWQRPEATAREFTTDDYFRTGDLGRVDDDGYLVLVGRSRDLVISGGYNVYPKEVELVIDTLPGVKESAIIGVPDADLGEAVTAVVVPETDTPALTADMVRSALEPQLAGYKVPKRVVFRDELPRNAMGKVQKNVLREEYAR